MKIRELQSFGTSIPIISFMNLHFSAILRVYKPFFLIKKPYPRYLFSDPNNLSLFKIVVLLTVFGCCDSEAMASDYYFSTSSGKDSRSTIEAQNPSTPWRTIAKLNEFFPQLRPGDRLLFNRGDTFFGSIQLDGSGIFLGSYGTGDKPVITSLKTINDWEDHGDGIYYSIIEDLNSEDISILLLDRQIQELGRYPNSDNADGGFLSITDATSESLTGPHIPFDVKGAEVVMRKNNWIIDRFPILNQNENKLAFNNDSPYPIAKNYGFFIQKHVSTLDKFGEWFYDIKTQKLYVFFGNDHPEKHKIEVAMFDNLVTSKDKTHKIGVKLEGLTFMGSNDNLIDVNHIINFQLSNCDLSFSGRDGVHLYAVPNSLIEGNSISYCLNNGIFSWYGATDAQVVGNRISHTMPFPGMSQNSDLNGIGIYLAADSDRSIIKENQIVDTGYSGIYFGGDWVTVSKNLIDGYCKLKFDGGGIYTNSQGLTDRNYLERTIDHNIVLNGISTALGIPLSESVPPIEGIYLDDNSRGLTVVDNTVANVNGRGIYLHNARNTVIERNFLFNNTYGIYLAHDQLGDPVRNVEIKENYFLLKKNNQRFIGISSILDDVSMVGSIDHNYYLDPFSRGFTFQDLSLSRYPRTDRNITNWRESYGFDVNSNYSDMGYQEYNISSYQKLKESDFTSDAGIISGTYNGKSAIAGSHAGPGALRVTTLTNQPTTLFIQIGKVREDENIYFESETRSDNPNEKVTVYLEKSQRSHPNTPLSGFPGTTEFAKNTILLTSLTEVPNESIVISIPEGMGEMIVKTIKISKVVTEALNLDDKLLFTYNYSDLSFNQTLNGTYMDAKGRKYSDSIEIPPYSGNLLVKVTEQ